MKRIWLLLFAILPFTNVYAISTHYSDYRDYILGTSEVLDLDDTLKKREYKVYNTVVTNIIDQGYVSENECDNKYENDTKTTYSIRPTVGYNTWYTSVTIPKGNINKIIVYNLSVNNIKDISIYDGNNKVDTTIYPSSDAYLKLIDDDLSTYNRIVEKENILLSFSPMNSQNFKISFKSDQKFKGKIIFYYEDGNKISKSMNSDELDVVDDDYFNELKNIVGLDADGNLNTYEKVSKTLYHCYKKEDVITNIYKESVSAINERLIEDDYKTLYDYYIRDKVKISDKKITSDKTTLKELVTYSTIDLDNLRIDGVVDYSTNGTYPVKFIFRDDFIVDKDVVINIAKNNKVVVEPTTTKSTSTTTKTTTTSTTRKTTTSSTTSTSTKPSTTTTVVTTTTSKPKPTTKSIRPNDTCPTYNTYDDEEVLEVEPLKGKIAESNNEEQQTKKKNKFIFKMIMLVITIILVILYIIFRIIENKKETC